MTKFSKVLLIDDDNLSNLIAKMAITHSAIADMVEVVTGAEEGLKIISKGLDEPAELPDLIFLDLNMPIMDGWDFLEEYKKIESSINKKIYIVILSSSVFSKDLERASEYKQVLEYVSKPLKVEMLQDLHQRITVNHKTV